MRFDPVECGKRIVKLRLEQRETQQQISDKLNISLDHYRAIEAGRRVGSLDLLIEIAFIFGVSLDFLILGQDKLLAIHRVQGERKNIIEQLDHLLLSI